MPAEGSRGSGHGCFMGATLCRVLTRTALLHLIASEGCYARWTRWQQISYLLKTTPPPQHTPLASGKSRIRTQGWLLSVTTSVGGCAVSVGLSTARVCARKDWTVLRYRFPSSSKASQTPSRVCPPVRSSRKGSAGSPLLHSAVRALVSPRVPWAQEAGLSLAKCPKVPEVPTPRRWG